jgi:mono/diheme cytochrome c family protein
VKRLLLLIATCGAGACGAAAKPPQPLALTAAAPIDTQATAVVEQGDALYVLSGKVAMIVRGGIVATRAEFPHAWIGGASIAAPDGDGRWVVAIDDEGIPWHLTLSGEREAIADRFGLGGTKLVQLAASGTTFAADLGDVIAYTTDGVHLSRVTVGPTRTLAVARGVLARVAKAGKLERWDLGNRTRTTYAISPTHVAFLDGDTDHPRIVAADGDTLWVERDGKLRPQHLPRVAVELAAHGTRAWIAAAGELYMLDGDHVQPARTSDHHTVLLAAATAGDAWLATERGLVRYSRNASESDPLWQSQVAPVFQRVCSHCHLPGGEAGIDLSTAASWASDRDEIRRRVLVTRTMPPAGTELGDADRAALEHYLGAK